MARGGPRPGSGRPPGPHRRLEDYWDQKKIDEYFEYLCDNYKEDSRLMVFVGEHLMGKAPQSIDHTTLGKEMPQPLLNVIQNNNGDGEDKKA